MRKKMFTVLSLLIVLCVVGFFRFLDVDAKGGTNQQSMLSSTTHDIPVRAELTVGKTIDHESAFLITSPENEEDLGEAVEVVSTVNTSAVEANSVDLATVGAEVPDSIELFGATYVKITDEKFSLYIDEANELRAGFYAIPNSDLFAMVKNGEVLFQMSTGIKSVPIENAELLIRILEKSGDFVGVGPIAEDIRKVVKTGETISAEGPNYTGYSVFIQDGWVIVSF